MNPRSVIEFFQSRTGKLVSFGALLTLVLVLAARNRFGAEPDETADLALEPGTNRPQVVETVNRAMQVFRPPASKPEPIKVAPLIPIPPASEESPAVPALPIRLVAASQEEATEPVKLEAFAPYGRLVSCQTVITVDSSALRTPIIGLVTDDVYHAGELIIPAGTEVHGWGQPDRVRERLGSAGSWTFVWQDGRELRLSALALDREFDRDQAGWGITDGSAGLRGTLLKSDNLAELKLFAATALSGAAKALTEKERTILGSLDTRSLNNAPFKAAEEVLGVYAQGIFDSIARDGFYVRVPAGKQFYLYILETIEPNKAAAGGKSISEESP